jgi:hypothetical protein
MPVNHAGTGVPHHSPNLLPHNGLVAMHRTLDARRFILLEWTFVEALPGITQKLAALEAEFISGSMLSTTIDVDHSLNGLVLPCYSRMVVRHDECLLQVLSTQPPFNGNETSRPPSPLQHPAPAREIGRLTGLYRCYNNPLPRPHRADGGNGAGGIGDGSPAITWAGNHKAGHLCPSSIP